MLDINQLRRDLPSVIAKLETRQTPQKFLNVAAYQALEAERKTLQTRTEELQAQRNKTSKDIGKEIGTLMGQRARYVANEDFDIVDFNDQRVEFLKSSVVSINSELDSATTRLDVLQAELQTLLLAVPNLPHDSVPTGEDEHGNVVLRSWGSPKNGGAQCKFLAG